MPVFSIAVDLSSLMPANSALNRDAFPSLALAVQMVIDKAEETWKGFASGAPLPNGKSIGIRSGQYLRSINQRKSGDFSGEVYSELAYADTIERGSPARDMKEVLNSSLKVRVSQKSGKRYLIIPFRHNTGDAMSGGARMPDAVQAWWQSKVASFVKSQHERPVHSDINETILPWRIVSDVRTRGILMTPARRYTWGTRLGSADLQALGASAEQTKRMAGMVNFRRPGQTGGAAHSQFITFRTMSEGSPGWRQKARDGLYPARTTADIYRPVAEDLFRAAVEDDIKRLLPGG
jgi:hypothetical protein